MEDDYSTISFKVLPEGVEIIDIVDRNRYTLQTSGSVSPTSADVNTFTPPIDAAISITTETVTLPTVALVYVHDQSGAIVTKVEHFASESLPDGAYCLEISAPVKIYLQVDSKLEISSNDQKTYLDFSEEVEVYIGARSYHDRPAATITTSDDPLDIMAAVSTFSSALKTTTPERSYPTLRGHPPTVELGDALEIPDNLCQPDTGLAIEIPATYEHIYVAAPLAYYLGAELVPSDKPRIVANSGFEYSLESPQGFEREVERVLQQTFFLDCLTRTAGLYPVELHERQAVETTLDIDFNDLYDWPLAAQLEAYLDIPFSDVEEYIPKWNLTTHIEPVADSVEILPFLINDLAVIKTPKTRTVATPDALATAFDGFVRNSDFTRSAAASENGTTTYVQPEQADSLLQSWVGEGTPISAGKATKQAYHNRLDRKPSEENAEIAVVCNDPDMDAERTSVDRVYGSRAELPFDVTIHHSCTVEELRTLLTSPTDFLHYIGHIDRDGFGCSDGTLDASDLDSVGVGAFLLNGCASYEQGMHLLEAGGIGGVVTLNDVINSGAVRIGCAMARLLNCGFPVGAALEIAREESIVGGQYLVVGDGGIAVVQAQNGIPNLCEVVPQGDSFEVSYKTYPTSHSGMGGVTLPYIDGADTYSLFFGVAQTFVLSRDEFAKVLKLEDAPIRLDGKLRWPDQIDINEL